MKKGFFKTFATISLAGAMTVGMASSAMAANASSGQLTGSVGEIEVVYNVTVPTDMSFDFNQYGIAATGAELELADVNQVYMPNVIIENRTTNAAVRVTYNIELDLAVGAVTSTLVARDAVPNAADNTDNELFMGVIAADEFTVATDTELTYDPANAATIIPFVANEDSATLGEVSVPFALAKYDGTTLTAGNQAGFTLFGVVNTYAAWTDASKEGVVGISGTYDLLPMSDTAYTEAVENQVAHNTLGGAGGGAVDPENNVKFNVGATTATLTVARATLTAAGGLKIYVADKPATVTSARNASTNFNYVLTTDYTYDATTGVFTLKTLPNANTANIAIVAGGKTYTLSLTLS